MPRRLISRAVVALRSWAAQDAQARAFRPRNRRAARQFFHLAQRADYCTPMSRGSGCRNAVEQRWFVAVGDGNGAEIEVQVSTVAASRIPYDLSHQA
jgi:hypothetical protein